MPMSPRARVLAVLRGQRPDCVPWFGDLDYLATAQIGRGQRPEGFKQSAAYLDWHRDLNLGFYLQGYFPFRGIVDGCETREWREGHDRVRQIITPHGTLQERWRWLPESFTEGPVEHLLKGAADLPAYQFLHAHTRYEADYAFGLERGPQIGEAGLHLAYLPKSPFMQLVALDAGIIAAVDMLDDAPALFAETLAVVEQSHDAAAALAVASPAELLMIPENLSSESVGPVLFEKFMRGYQEKWTARIRAAGKFSCMHLDGTLRGLLRQECTVGFDFIESLTPSPVGDLAVEDWKAFCGETPTRFWGGIPGAYFAPSVSEAEFERHVRATLAVMRTEPRYFLGVADQVPPDGLEHRLRRVAELVEEYGRY
ncbi:MAG TPA: uroporphyrinogen decarboxylase family protein [Opitutaceae bacterium]|nr:uroporphyrinogen decarboxylase family protein [Opitutaceae bacterium]